MGDGLSSLAADVRDHSIAVGQAFRLGESSDHEEQVADERTVGVFHVVDRYDFLFRDHQDVGRRLGLDVAERQTVFVFVKDLGWDFAIDDSLENGFSAHRHFSVKKDWSAVAGCVDYPARSVTSPEFGSMGHRRIPSCSPAGSPGSTCAPNFKIAALARVLLATVAVCSAGSVAAQDVYVEQNGVLFREQRYVERRPVTSWQWEERQEIVYREEFVTTFREDRQTIQVPVAVANPNGGPPWQRYELRTQIVRSPVVTRQMVPETRTVRVPVRKLGFVGEERVARVPLGPAPGAVGYSPNGMPGIPGVPGMPGVPGGMGGVGSGPATMPPQTARRPWKGMAVSGFDPTLNRW